MSSGRPKGVTILAILEVVIGIYFLVTGFGEFFGGAINPFAYHIPPSVISIIFRVLGATRIILGFVSLLLAWGLWTGKRWARMAALIFAILSIIENLISLHFIGVVIGAIIVYYLTRPTVKQWFTKT